MTGCGVGVAAQIRLIFHEFHYVDNIAGMKVMCAVLGSSNIAIAYHIRQIYRCRTNNVFGFSRDRAYTYIDRGGKYSITSRTLKEKNRKIKPRDVVYALAFDTKLLCQYATQGYLQIDTDRNAPMLTLSFTAGMP